MRGIGAGILVIICQLFIDFRRFVSNESALFLVELSNRLVY